MAHLRNDSRRFLATVLFTDVVGSTERAAALGDRGWRDLLEKHHAVVRRELRRFQGREMDTAGDGFFAVFETPERAVRAASGITAAVAGLGLQVRAGVHMGECEVIGGKVGGTTVNIGARIAALAEPGEVLVSSNVRDMTGGSGLVFEGGEERPLKGVEEPWRVFRLVDGGVDPDDSRRGTGIVPLYTRRQRLRGVVAAVAVLAVALVVVPTYLVHSRSEAEVVVGEDTAAVIGPGNEVRVAAVVSVGGRPTGVAGGAGTVWVTNATSGTVSHIDTRTNAAVQIPVGASPSGVTVGAGSVWVANSGAGTVSRIDPATSLTRTIQVRQGPTGIIVAAGKVWVTNALDASVTVIEPDTERLLPPIPVGAGPTGIAYGAGSVWVTNQAEGTVSRINPATATVEATIPVGQGPSGIAVGGGAVWVANNLDGSLSRINTEDQSVTSLPLAKGGGAYGVAAHGPDVWVSNEYAGTLSRVQGRSLTLRDTVRVRGAPLGLAFIGKDLWFTSAGGGSALHRGGVLTMVGPAVNFDNDPPVLDPADFYSEFTWRLAALSYDGLVGFRRAAGVQGGVPVPDLATSIPSPTDGGRTYTFRLRAGVRYSDGTVVVADDVRRGIERTLLHDGGPWQYFATELVGGQACRDRVDQAVKAQAPRPTTCDLGSGIVADDRARTVTFHLTRPTPEFVYQLAFPGAAAVPHGTPAVLPPGTFLPATGPYRIGSYRLQKAAGKGQPAVPGELELVRNPHFHVWSGAAQPGGYPDRIVLRTGYTEREAVRQISRGQADVVWSRISPDVAAGLTKHYGRQLQTNPGLFIRMLFLRTTDPPFNNRDARRAVAFALDRRLLASRPASFAGPVTCQLIPPNFPGYAPYCPFTLGGDNSGAYSGPDLREAQRLVQASGTKGAKVVVVLPSDPGWQAKGRRVIALLGELGYRASPKTVAADNYGSYVTDPSRHFQVTLSGWGADYPAASNFIAGLAACNPALTLFNVSRYCDRSIEAGIAAAVEQQVADPGKASDAWAALDRQVVDDAAIIPFFGSLQQDFVSKRVDNVLVNPQLGPLISQMWVL